MSNGRFGIWRWGVLAKWEPHKIRWAARPRPAKLPAYVNDRQESFRAHPTGERSKPKPFPWSVVLVCILTAVILIMTIVAVTEYARLGFWESLGVLFLIIPLTVLAVMIVIGVYHISSAKAKRKYRERIEKSRFNVKTRTFLIEMQGADSRSIKEKRKVVRISALLTILSGILSSGIVVILSVTIMLRLVWVLVPLATIIIALVFIALSSKNG